jgi:hypothetical protein
MRVRSTFDALRLCALVAAGATSGYLWRAAFESSSPEARLAGTPRIVETAPAPPVVRVPATQSPSRRHATAPRLVGRPERAARAPAALISGRAAVTRRPTQPATPGQQPPPPPSTSTPTTPAPTPTPTPATPTPPQPPAPPAPATTSTQATPPATTSTHATPPAATPTPPASPPSPPAPATPPETASDDSRPGWGKGDKNHEHTGPGGGGKP